MLRRPMTAVRSSVVIVIGCVWVACHSSPPTASESSEDDGMGEDDGVEVVMDPDVGCRGVQFSLSPSEESELGFSADDAAAALISYESVLAWLPANGPVQYVPGESLSGVTIVLSAAEGEAFYVRSLDCEHTTCPVSCISQVQLPVAVDFFTESGEFSERWTGRLGSWKVGKGFIQHELLPEHASGAISSSDFVVNEGWKAETYTLQIELNDGSSRGRFQVKALFADDPEPLYGALAVWPPPG